MTYMGQHLQTGIDKIICAIKFQGLEVVPPFFNVSGLALCESQVLQKREIYCL